MQKHGWILQSVALVNKDKFYMKSDTGAYYYVPHLHRATVFHTRRTARAHKISTDRVRKVALTKNGFPVGFFLHGR